MAHLLLICSDAGTWHRACTDNQGRSNAHIDARLCQLGHDNRQRRARPEIIENARRICSDSQQRSQQDIGPCGAPLHEGSARTPERNKPDARPHGDAPQMAPPRCEASKTPDRMVPRQHDGSATPPPPRTEPARCPTAWLHATVGAHSDAEPARHPAAWCHTIGQWCATQNEANVTSGRKVPRNTTAARTPERSQGDTQTHDATLCDSGAYPRTKPGRHPAPRCHAARQRRAPQNGTFPAHSRKVLLHRSTRTRWPVLNKQG